MNFGVGVDHCDFFLPADYGLSHFRPEKKIHEFKATLQVQSNRNIHKTEWSQKTNVGLSNVVGKKS